VAAPADRRPQPIVIVVTIYDLGRGTDLATAPRLGPHAGAILPRVSTISGTTRLVGILGWPVEHSLSPGMHNAAFAALGLDWAYVPLPTPPEELEDALRGLVALGFAGANVTMPHKLEAARLCKAEIASVNTLVVRDGRLEASSTDAAVLAGLRAERPVVVGSGGAAAAFLDALPHARAFSRRGEWPPSVAEADLVVNATSERDDVLVELRPGQTLVDLPYPETATARAAREAGATVVSGLEVLLAQGAASFERWTGVPAPVEAMRAALGLPT
jgi:shikimate dehydrogenase